MFEGWKYQKIFDHFQKICVIPHGSYHEGTLSEYVYQFALSQGYTAMRDGHHNVLVRIPASEGREQEPSCLLQGHLDMVCEKEDSVSYDFLKDPIRIHQEEDWLMAEGTTLGGDDGIAIAYMLTLMEEASQISHPSLELLMTSAEEVGMDGRQRLRSFLDSVPPDDQSRLRKRGGICSWRSRRYACRSTAPSAAHIGS